ncbi:MAG TPA: 3-phosphoglycerate dehydrogenase [Burkholderiaceae bacterium]|nr:3-phosphoglycerate dehydrogenase [Burkholderiaceae bacterium]
MRDPVDALVLELLEWIGSGTRPYLEVMEAWRTSCPRLPVWEEANLRGLVETEHAPGQERHVRLTAKGGDVRRRARQRGATAIG